MSRPKSAKSWLRYVILAITLAVPAGALAEVRKILVLGDSLSAGYNLPEDAAFPAVLERTLRAQGRKITVVNAGVSGDTAGAGLARLDWVLTDDVDAVIVELGANDMLRGLDPQETERSLDKILATLKQKNKRILLAGMVAAPGMGKTYEERFNGIFPRLAEKYRAILYPFFLEGVATQRDLLLNDGMHPNRAGVELIVRNILPSVLKFVDVESSN